MSMKYKISVSNLIRDRGEMSEREAIRNLYDITRAILYFFEVGNFAISEELYKKLDNDGKQYFLGVK